MLSLYDFDIFHFLIAAPLVYFGLRFLWFSALVSSSLIKYAKEHELRGAWKNGGYFVLYIGILICIYAPVTARIPHETTSRIIGAVLVLSGVIALWTARRSMLKMKVSAIGLSGNDLTGYSQGYKLEEVVDETCQRSEPLNAEDKVLVNRIKNQAVIDEKLSGFDWTIYASAVLGGIVFISGIILWQIDIRAGVSDPPSIREHAAVAMFLTGIILFLPLIILSIRSLLTVKNSTN